MGSFRQLLSDDATPPSAPGHAGLILHDPQLIDALLRDHAELGRLFGRIGNAGMAGNFGETRSLLATFKARLKAHVVAESVCFYDYLEQSLANEPKTVRMVRTYRRKMSKIASDLFDFIDRYKSCMFDPDERAQFAVDYEEMGRALERRLDSEEDNLYRLYRPS